MCHGKDFVDPQAVTFAIVKDLLKRYVRIAGYLNSASLKTFNNQTNSVSNRNTHSNFENSAGLRSCEYGPLKDCRLSRAVSRLLVRGYLAAKLAQLNVMYYCANPYWRFD
ncbi:hypothetical protein KIN20_020731 [Parelaphostrongylus tenuis]|uniref:Uncharacterized protein n=1 Tax=Parelaphostrongylus tenuis TaxID=148309 RepID=A0AAD5MT76_PARTN|nr:hypothetical protein KIN20_020731 [Parelaphostrongylus tenuis]